MNPHREPGVSNFDRIVELECENATLRNRLAEKPKPKEPGLLRRLINEYEVPIDVVVVTLVIGILSAVFAVGGKLVYKLVVWL